jgi:ABC-type Fe3+ transport system permease subunit
MVRLGAWRVAAAALTWCLLLLIMAVPLGNLLYQAGAVVEHADGRVLRYWSARRLVQVIFDSGRLFRAELAWSLSISAVAASAAVLVATPLAWGARRRGVQAAPALTVAAVCLALPGPLVGLGLVWLFSRSDWPVVRWLYDRTILAPVLAVLVRCLPLAILAIWYSLQSVAAETLDSAATEGAGPLTRFWRIAAPQRRLGFAVVWLAAFAVAMGDLAASIMAAPPGVTTVSIRVFGLMHAGVRSQEAGICLISTAGAVLVAAAALRLLKGGRTSR